jgi:hypothetical protein
MRWLLIGILGCWEAPRAPGVVVQRDPSIVITQTGFGPIDAKTAATLTNLRTLLPAYHVAPKHDPHMSANLQYDIFDGNDQIGFVMTNDDASVFNVHATSGKVRVENHTWRVGEAFQDAKLVTECLCWGSNPVCFKHGEHVAVNFNRTCIESDDPHALRALDGLVIQRIIWSPTAFGVEDSEPSSSPIEDDEP